MQVEREGCVVELGADPVCAAKRAGAFHLLDGGAGEDFAGLVVLCEGLEELFVAEEFFEHLRGDFDEVAFSGEAGEAGPLGLAAEDGVHEVAELMEERDDVGVLHEAGVVCGGLREVADEGGFRHVAAFDAGDDGRGGEPLVLAFAGVHVEIETTNLHSTFNDVKDADGRVPALRIGAAEFDFEEACGGIEDALLDLRVREVGADGLRVEVDSGRGGTAHTSSHGWWCRSPECRADAGGRIRGSFRARGWRLRGLRR